MASASSSVVRPIPTGPQVFICFRGKDVRKNFISFLDHALREAKIKVFTVEDEFLGSDLDNLLKRIEESEIALVIFSEDFTSSYWCLDELAKIKERKDQGCLKVIPIFYKVQPSVVKYLRGQFGDNFRDLTRKHLHQPQRILNWEKALKTVPGTKGMPLAEQSETTDNDFITKMVIQIQRLLEDMAVKRDQEKEGNHQGGTIVTIKNPKKEAKRQGDSIASASEPDKEHILIGEGSVVPSMVCAKDLEITHSDQPQKWIWSTINEGPNDRNEREFMIEIIYEIQRLLSQIAMKGNPKVESNFQGGFLVPARRLVISHSENPQKWTWSAIYDRPHKADIEIATMINTHASIKITGDFHTRKLTPGTIYEVLLLVRLDDTSLGWKKEVTLGLKLVHQSDDTGNERLKKSYLDEYIGENWVEIYVGEFESPPKREDGKIFFSMFQYMDTDKKSGLIVKGFAIRPKQ